jgi:hypothetical protein
MYPFIYIQIHMLEARVKKLFNKLWYYCYYYAVIWRKKV